MAEHPCYYCKKKINSKKPYVALSIHNSDKPVEQSFEIYCNPNCVVDDLLETGYGNPNVIVAVTGEIITNSVENAIAKKVIPKDLKPAK